jgi:signal transduction histidine kinase
MKIRSFQVLNSWGAVLTTVVVCCLLFVVIAKTQRAERHDEASSRLLVDLLEQRAVALEYARRPSIRAAARWRVLHEEIAGLVAAFVPATAEESLLVRELDGGHARAGQLFATLVSLGQRQGISEAGQPNRGDEGMTLALTDVSRRLIARARQLQALSAAEARLAHRLLVAGTIAALAALALVALGNLAFTIIRVLRPLQKLSSGAESIAGGSLSHRIGLQSADEMGDLSRSFDAMAARIEDLVDDLHRKKTALIEANTELESFTHAVAHDLRAPLQAIDGFSQQVMEIEGERLSPRARHYLERVRAAAARAESLIGALLELAQAGRGALRREPVNMEALVHECLGTLEHQMRGREIGIHLEPLPMCEGDRLLLKQVWMNLLSNAVKYTSGRKSACIRVRGRATGDACTFEVEDNGAGFDVTYAARLFQPFQRLHSESEFPGTGVGLALVQRILHRHGGGITANARPGRGAMFSFSLPR